MTSGFPWPASRVGAIWRRIVLWIVLASLAIGAVLALVFWARPEKIVDVGDGSRGETVGRVYFGGPDKPAGVLRDVLLAKVRAMPPGQSIDWATYYFLDSELAQALIDASQRGVKVRLVVEGDPRFENANGTVLKMLRQASLSNGLTVREEAPFHLDVVSGKLHSKIYAFSWPKPVALVGSFNPSGGVGDDPPAIMREIGDQDRGHNLLVEITSPGLVSTLVSHVAELAAHGGRTSRFSTGNNDSYRDRDTQIYFYPRLRTEVVEHALDQLGAGDRLWATISHLKGAAAGTLEDAVERGASVHLIVHDTERRVPQAVVDRLAANGVDIRRYHRADGLPMHDKFFIIENNDRWVVYFGSLNFNRNSRLLNDEVVVRSTNPQLAKALLDRFLEIAKEVN